MNFREIVQRHIGPPVNIEAIIRSLGISLDKKARLDASISGQLERLGPENYKISVNDDGNYFRARFTMAHELGHYLLHAHLIGEGVDDSLAYRSEPDGNFYNQNIGPSEETEANKFAAGLLMPKSKLTAEDAVGRSIVDLAKLFQVSQKAMEIRLKGLGFLIEDGVVTAAKP